MIRSFAHKGLRKFFEEGTLSGIQSKHATKLRLILATIHRAKTVEETNFHGANLHSLKGEMKGMWSVTVNGNWRVIFRFENGDAYVIDYIDYH